MVDGSTDLCLVDPGYEVDLIVTATIRSLTEVWMGDRAMKSAIADGSIELEGPRELVRRFPGWMGAHPILGSVARAGGATN